MLKIRKIKSRKRKPTCFRKYVGFTIRYRNLNFEVITKEDVIGIQYMWKFIPLKNIGKILLKSEWLKTQVNKLPYYYTYSEVKANCRLPKHLRLPPPEKKRKIKSRKKHA